MKAAGILTLLGSIVVFGLGLFFYGIALQDLVIAWFVANFFGMLAVAGTLELQRIKFLRSPLQSWICFFSIWIGGLLLGCPYLRQAETLAVFFLPLAMCTGPSILIWGQFQDWLVARRQRQ